MATKEEALEALKKVESRFDDEALKPRFAKFSKTMQFTFPDLETSFTIEVEAGEVRELKEGRVDKPDIHVTTDSTTFIGIMDRTSSPMHAYTAGKLKVKGTMTDLIKLKKLM